MKIACFLRRLIRYLFLPLVIISFVTITNLTLTVAETKNRTPHYVGSETCKGCHKDVYDSFMSYARKSRSFSSIERVKKGLTEEEIKGCYSCHTTGYGKPGGFVSPEKTPHLKDAGCEVCHGPGEFHVKTKNPQYIKRRMTKEECEVCHTSERVRAFRYKPMIHGGAH
jgi:hypothetical protein